MTSHDLLLSLAVEHGTDEAVDYDELEAARDTDREAAEDRARDERAWER